MKSGYFYEGLLPEGSIYCFHQMYIFLRQALRASVLHLNCRAKKRLLSVYKVNIIKKKTFDVIAKYIKIQSIKAFGTGNQFTDVSKTNVFTCLTLRLPTFLNMSSLFCKPKAKVSAWFW